MPERVSLDWSLLKPWGARESERFGAHNLDLVRVVVIDQGNLAHWIAQDVAAAEGVLIAQARRGCLFFFF